VGQEVKNIAACAQASGDLEDLVQALRNSGAWGILPIEWPDEAALLQVRATAAAYLLHSGTDGASDDLVDRLRARPDHTPLIVVGPMPTPRASPSVWLPSVPSSAVLGPLLDQLIAPESAGTTSTPVWRRKSDMIIGHSAPIRRVLAALDQLAPAQTPVLITGESGVGKELVARALHFSGPRAAAPFVALNCAAIPESLIEAELFGYQRGAFTGAVAAHAGAFESADKGTLFLDELGEMPLAMQAKLLRVLETNEVRRLGSNERRHVDFRLVTATNRDLHTEIKNGRFREDLYYRVQVYPLDIPPLRDRPDDIPQLVTHHLAVIAARDKRGALRMTPAALEKLVRYTWPGNVRELVNQLERATLVAGNQPIDADHILLGRARTGDDSALPPYREAKSRFETEYYERLMRTANGNVSLAAKLAHKTRKEIYDALKRCGLPLQDERGRRTAPPPVEPRRKR
jgi:transcriptional regulator with GAF, ATPase, and Fis domain